MRRRCHTQTCARLNTSMPAGAATSSDSVWPTPSPAAELVISPAVPTSSTAIARRRSETQKRRRPLRRNFARTTEQPIPTCVVITAAEEAAAVSRSVTVAHYTASTAASTNASTDASIAARAPACKSSSPCAGASDGGSAFRARSPFPAVQQRASGPV